MKGSIMALLVATLVMCLLPSAAWAAGYLCEECMDVSTRAQAFVSDPNNQEAAIAYVEASVCEKSVMPDYKNKCQGMVEEYVPIVFSTLEDYLSPDNMCVKSGLCRPGSIFSRLFSEFGRAGNAVLLRTYSQLMRDKKFRSFVYGRLTRDNCAVCKYLVAELKVKLQDPKTQEKLLEFLMDNCQKLQSHEDECKLLVLEYGPLVLANVNTILDDQFCTRVGMCPEDRNSGGHEQL